MTQIEEKMRLLHDEKKRRLSRMNEKGAEPHKIRYSIYCVIMFFVRILYGVGFLEAIWYRIVR